LSRKERGRCETHRGKRVPGEKHLLMRPASGSSGFPLTLPREPIPKFSAKATQP
jgi:hypothetical protein